MRFVLSPNCLPLLDKLQTDYEDKRKVNLNEPPSTLGMPLFLGGTDVVTRKEQIDFLRKVRVVLHPNLLDPNTITTFEGWQYNLTAYKTLIAASLFIKKELGRNSGLKQLLNECFGIDGTNYLDQQDKQACFSAAQRFLTTAGAFEDANAALTKAGLTAFTDAEWNKFYNFIKGECERFTQPINEYNLPITSVTKPFFGTVFKCAGATAGFLGGDVVSHSTLMMPNQYKLTAALGGFLILGPMSPGGVTLLAPIIASRLINTFCSVTLAQVLSAALEIIGKGVGIGVGLPLDAAYRLLYAACEAINSYFTKANMLNGIRICDGSIMANGVPIAVKPQENIDTKEALCTFDMRADGTLVFDGEPIKASNKDSSLPPDLMSELQHRLLGAYKSLNIAAM